MVLKMPNSEVVLNGDQSSDDKPGLKYLWEIVSDQRGLDLEVSQGRVGREGVGKGGKRKERKRERKGGEREEEENERERRGMKMEEKQEGER